MNRRSIHACEAILGTALLLASYALISTRRWIDREQRLLAHDLERAHVAILQAVE